MKTLNELANTGNRFAVIALDETAYWDEKTAQKAKKIEGVYLVDLMQPTHLCELSVSYPATWLRNFFHNTEDFSEDTLTNLELIENGGNAFTYFAGSTTPKLIRFYKDGSEEEAIENEKCNPSYC